MNNKNNSSRDEILMELAGEIAKDTGTWTDEREMAWAVQHVNEAILNRNVFSGTKGITREDAEAGLADYRQDRRRWSNRIYDEELAQGLRRCSRETGKGFLPKGTIVHNIGNKDYTDKHVELGYADAVWTLDECPARHEHK